MKKNIEELLWRYSDLQYVWCLVRTVHNENAWPTEKGPQTPTHLNETQRSSFLWSNDCNTHILQWWPFSLVSRTSVRVHCALSYIYFLCVQTCVGKEWFPSILPSFLLSPAGDRLQSIHLGSHSWASVFNFNKFRCICSFRFLHTHIYIFSSRTHHVICIYILLAQLIAIPHLPLNVWIPTTAMCLMEGAAREGNFSLPSHPCVRNLHRNAKKGTQ